MVHLTLNTDHLHQIQLFRTLRFLFTSEDECRSFFESRVGRIIFRSASLKKASKIRKTLLRTYLRNEKEKKLARARLLRPLRTWWNFFLRCPLKSRSALGSVLRKSV